MGTSMDRFILSLLWIVLGFLDSVASGRRRQYLEQAVLEAYSHEKREKFERLQYRYEKIYTARMRGKMSPFFSGDPRITKRTDWVMGFDGTPYGMEMLIIIFLPLFAAKGLSLIMRNFEPIPPCMDKCPKLPFIPLFYHQSTAVERELRRPLRSGIIAYANNFVIRADDEIIDRKHIRYLLNTHQKINTQASRNPWHTVRMLLRINQLSSKSDAFKRKASKPDMLQTFLDGFTNAMKLNEMHRKDEAAFLDKLRLKQEASDLHLKSKLVQVRAKEHYEQHKGVVDHLEVKTTALHFLHEKAIEAQKRKLEEKKDQLKRAEKMLRWEKKQAQRAELKAKRATAINERQRSIIDLEIADMSLSDSSDSDSDSSKSDNKSEQPKEAAYAVFGQEEPKPTPDIKSPPGMAQPKIYAVTPDKKPDDAASPAKKSIEKEGSSPGQKASDAVSPVKKSMESTESEDRKKTDTEVVSSPARKSIDSTDSQDSKTTGGASRGKRSIDSAGSSEQKPLVGVSPVKKSKGSANSSEQKPSDTAAPVQKSIDSADAPAPSQKPDDTGSPIDKPIDSAGAPDKKPTDATSPDTEHPHHHHHHHHKHEEDVTRDKPETKEEKLKAQTEKMDRFLQDAKAPKAKLEMPKGDEKLKAETKQLHFSRAPPKTPPPKRDRYYDIARSGFKVPEYIHGVYKIDDPENLLRLNQEKNNQMKEKKQEQKRKFAAEARRKSSLRKISSIWRKSSQSKTNLKK